MQKSITMRNRRVMSMIERQTNSAYAMKDRIHEHKARLALEPAIHAPATKKTVRQKMNEILLGIVKPFSQRDYAKLLTGRYHIISYKNEEYVFVLEQNLKGTHILNIKVMEDGIVYIKKIIIPDLSKLDNKGINKIMIQECIKGKDSIIKLNYKE